MLAQPRRHLCDGVLARDCGNGRGPALLWRPGSDGLGGKDRSLRGAADRLDRASTAVGVEHDVKEYPPGRARLSQRPRRSWRQDAAPVRRLGAGLRNTLARIGLPRGICARRTSAHPRLLRSAFEAVEARDRPVLPVPGGGRPTTGRDRSGKAPASVCCDARKDCPLATRRNTEGGSQRNCSLTRTRPALAMSRSIWPLLVAALVCAESAARVRDRGSQFWGGVALQSRRHAPGADQSRAGS